MEYLYELINLLNKFNGKFNEDTEDINRIRDLICYISDNPEYMNDKLFKRVIFEAAQMLRMFGYIKGENKIDKDEFFNDNISYIKYTAIENYYKSNVYVNNLLDKKQKDIVDTFASLENKRIIVSAPTSFGKTFILREIIFSKHFNYKNILLVFPTIALLNENSMDLSEIITKLNLDYKIVNNVYSEISESDKHIFILTPERTLKLLADNENLNIDFFFFDEVYKIDEDFSVGEDHEITGKVNNRSKAFRIVLYLLSKRVNDYYIAGPYLNLEHIRYGMKKYIEKNGIEVKQIKLEPTSKILIEAWNKKCIEYHPVLGKKTEEIYNKRPNNSKEKIKDIIKYINDNNLGQAIFYCNSPIKSMDYVKDILSEFKDTEKSKFSDFINHLKIKYNIKVKDRNSTQYWTLIKALEKGIGIHHGKFPKYIQNEILKLFNDGVFKYLFCTSTIIEGVNTNAKNIVIINNSVGTNKMTAFCLKNIKGRAGRYYHHTMGRVFYTDSKQRKTETEDDIMLDFQTYDDKEILNVDIDNSEIEDLSDNNKLKKYERERSFDKNILPDEVFVKNRLFERDIQEKYLKYIMKKEVFSHYEELIDNSNNINYILNHNIISFIIDSFKEVEIIDVNIAKIYLAVIMNYSKNRTKGVLDWHLNNMKMPIEDNVDKAYIDAFGQIRGIVEYEIPKLLCLFEALFQQAGRLLEYDMDSFDMSSIIRFFELGVTSEIGLFLVEFGFPVDTIVDIESKFSKIKKMDRFEAVNYLNQNYDFMNNMLDSYEKQLFLRAIKGIKK